MKKVLSNPFVVALVLNFVMALGIKVIVLSWWSFETHMNPNQKEVVHRRLAPHLYEEKPM
jgi:hypothetical protein